MEYFPAGMIDPAIIQRLLMGKMSVNLMLLFIAFSALILLPHVEAQQIVPNIINTLLPTGLKGLAIVSLLAICISSIDSYLHAAGTTFVHDVIQPLTKKRYNIHELSWMRYATVGLSLVAIFIALTTTNTFGLLLNSLFNKAHIL
jgi:SSS family solute:Na+ symporter